MTQALYFILNPNSVFNLIILLNPVMNYLFTPYAIIDPYQAFYSFVPQLLVETNAYYQPDVPKLEKQNSIQRSQTLTFEPQLLSKPSDQRTEPFRKTKKVKKNQDKNFGFREQDKERNIFSNIIKGFFISLTQKRAFDGFIQQSWYGGAQQRDLEEFHQKVSKIFSRCKSYFSPKSVKQILRFEKDEEGIRNMVQKCLYQYLKTQFPLSLLLSKRIKRKSKLLQMKKARELLSIFRRSQ